MEAESITISHVKDIMVSPNSRVSVIRVAGTDVVLKSPKHEAHVTNEIAALNCLHSHGGFVQYAILPAHCAGLLKRNTIALRYYSKGDLFDFFAGLQESSSFRLPEKFVKFAFLQIMMSIRYMHQCGIVHRDIKMENIFIDDNFNMVIGDFGMSGFADAAGRLISADGTCGSNAYLAPEYSESSRFVRNTNNVDAYRADIWSAGCVLFAMLANGSAFPFGEGPVTPSDMANFDWNAFWAKHVMYKTFPFVLSDTVKDLFQWMCHPDPTRRPSANDVLQHPWFTDSLCHFSEFAGNMAFLLQTGA